HLQPLNQHPLNITINPHPFHLNIPMYHFNHQPHQTIYHVLFLFPNSIQLKQLIQDINPHIHNQTILLSTINPLNHQQLIPHYLPQSQILTPLTTSTAPLETPPHTHLLPTPPLQIPQLLHQPKQNLIKLPHL
uniref:2-dehydropantoate 2-reductase N-terminal domain-containing protein n=1 Tax=Staphylococcus aureus TaxID=1280 RepID=UPI0028CBB617